ncbi:major facilitator superfamily domain-containing protein, partial [Lobosporangium transversale]
MTMALVLASFATKLWHLFLSQGLLFGIGASFVYFPAIAAPGHWFNKRRGLALGIGASGSGLGGFYLAPLAQWAVDHLGIRYALRTLALYCFIVWLSTEGSASASTQPDDFLSTATEAKSTEKRTKWRISGRYKESAFITLVLFQCLLSSAYLAPVYFMELYGSHIGISKQAAASINGWFNAASFVARVVSGVVADRISSSWCLLISTWLMVLSICVLWVLSKTYTVFLLFAIVYGFTFSGVSTVMPILVIEYYGAEKAASVLGTVYTMSSPALMLGTLVCGELL